jgi:hypothetical protein
MKSLETSLIQLENSRAFSNRMDALEFYNNQNAKKIPNSNSLKPILIIGGILLILGIGLYTRYNKSKDVKKRAIRV